MHLVATSSNYDIQNSNYNLQPSTFEQVMVDEEDISSESKEATMLEIKRIEESMVKKREKETTEDPLVKYDNASENNSQLDIPSCSSDFQPEVEQKEDQLDSFAMLMANEMRVLRSPQILRRLKMNLMKLVYEAQSEDEKADN